MPSSKVANGGGSGGALLTIVAYTPTIPLYYGYLMSFRIVNALVGVFGMLPVTPFSVNKVFMSCFLAYHWIVV